MTRTTRTMIPRVQRPPGRVLNLARGGSSVIQRGHSARARLGRIISGCPQGFLVPESNPSDMGVNGFTNLLSPLHGGAGYFPDLTGMVGMSGNVSLYVDHRRVKANSFREFNLHPMGRTINGSDNLSDSSLVSESYSAHVLGCTFAQLGRRSQVRNTETNIRYRYRSKRTDYVLELDQPINGVDIVAVEVKRLSDFGGKVDLTDQYVYNLLSKANLGAIESNKSVHPSDRWHTQILHVITDVPAAVDAIQHWCDTTVDTGFSWVFVTVVSGNSRVIIGY